jgi:hypothetical protein
MDRGSSLAFLLTSVLLSVTALFAPHAQADSNDGPPCYGNPLCDSDAARLNPNHPGCAFNPYQDMCFPNGTQRRY